eukprot:4989697-Prymnesium_polylepis.1
MPEHRGRLDAARQVPIHVDLRLDLVGRRHLLPFGGPRWARRAAPQELKSFELVLFQRVRGR